MYICSLSSSCTSLPLQLYKPEAIRILLYTNPIQIQIQETTLFHLQLLHQWTAIMLPQTNQIFMCRILDWFHLCSLLYFSPMRKRMKFWCHGCALQWKSLSGARDEMAKGDYSWLEHRFSVFRNKQLQQLYHWIHVFNVILVILKYVDLIHFKEKKRTLD